MAKRVSDEGRQQGSHLLMELLFNMFRQVIKIEPDTRNAPFERLFCKTVYSCFLSENQRYYSETKASPAVLTGLRQHKVTTADSGAVGRISEQLWEQKDISVLEEEKDLLQSLLEKENQPVSKAISRLKVLFFATDSPYAYLQEQYGWFAALVDPKKNIMGDDCFLMVLAAAMMLSLDFSDFEKYKDYREVCKEYLSQYLDIALDLEEKKTLLPVSLEQKIETESDERVGRYKNLMALKNNDSIIVHSQLLAGGSETLFFPWEESPAEDIDNNLEKLLSHRTVLITGEGGLGKSFLLVRLYDYFRNREEYLPVFVTSGSWVGKNSFSECFYGLDQEGITPSLQRKKIVFLIDGLNEVGEENRLALINTVNELTGGIYVGAVIATSRFVPGGLFAAFKEFRLEGLTDRQVSEELGKTVKLSESSILHTPIFLQMYKRMLSAQSLVEEISRYELLKRAFLDNPMGTFRSFRSIPNVREIFSFVVPCLAFSMVNKGKVFSSVREVKNIIRECIEKLSKGNISLYNDVFEASKAGFDWLKNLRDRVRDEDVVVEDVFSALNGTILTQEGIRISFYHQIIRDFFAAFYIKSSVLLLTEGEQGFLINELNPAICPSEVAEFLSDYDVRELQFSEDLPVENKVALYSVFYFVTYHRVETLHNSAAEKREVCRQLKQEVKNKAEEIRADADALFRGLDDVSCSSLLGILRLNAEIHRRVGAYKESREVSENLIWICNQHGNINEKMKKSTILAANNNISKCLLYEAHSEAEQFFDLDIAFTPEIMPKYTKAFDALKICADEGSVEAQNLLCLLLTTPDAVTAPYFQSWSAETMPETLQTSGNVLEAFRRSLITAREYNNTYAFQQCCSYLMHGGIVVSVWKQYDGVSHFPYDLQIRSGHIPEGNSVSTNFLADALGKLQNYSSHGMPSCFQALLELRRMEAGSRDRAKELLSRAFSYEKKDKAPAVIMGPLIASFLYAVLKDDPSSGEMAEAVFLKLAGAMHHHPVDAYSARYILSDLQRFWQNREKVGVIPSKELSCRIEELFACMELFRDRQKVNSYLFIGAETTDELDESEYDLLLILGNDFIDGTADSIVSLIREGYVSPAAPVILSGKNGSLNQGSAPEAERLFTALVHRMPELEPRLVKETKAGNCKENLAFSKTIIEDLGGFEKFGKILVIAKSYMLKRAEMTARAQNYPIDRLWYYGTIDTENVNLGKSTAWWREKKCVRLYEELLRIVHYTKKGDLKAGVGDVFWE